MGTPNWVNTIVGVPTIRNFGSTNGLGSPVVINVLDGAAYYAYKGTVYRIGVGVNGLSAPPSLNPPAP